MGTSVKQVLLVALLAGLQAVHSATRTVWISAEEEASWDYGQENLCVYKDASLNPPVEKWQKYAHPYLYDALPSAFKKARYVQYTDNWVDRKAIPSSQAHLGILGPLLYVEAGDTLIVKFRNNLPWPVNMQVKAASWANAGNVPPVPGNGGTATWTWTIPTDAVTMPPGITTPQGAAAAGIQTSRLFMYRSSVDPFKHDNAGLVGPMIVTAKGFANADGTTKGVDRDVVTLYQVADEAESAYAEENSAVLSTMSNTKTYAINGKVFCNLDSIEMNIGEKVRWHVASVGLEDNIHNFHWHGMTLLRDGHRVDHVNLVGCSSTSSDTVPDVPGHWYFHCHVNLHLDSGMQTTFNVKGKAPAMVAASGGSVRRYYIAAEQVEWNYAPQGGYCCGATCTPFDDTASTYLGETDGLRVGSIYTKAQYFEYTDASFTTKIPRAAEDAYMGILGPTIRGNVGDMIEVHFKNTLKYAVGIHPHGVLYDKTGEGAAYHDGTDLSMKADDWVLPGKTYTYRWKVMERSGPGPSDPSSVLWLYHSHTDESSDTNAGLFGAIVINRPGVATKLTTTGSAADAVGIPSDVDREAILLFTVGDEAMSTFALENVAKLDPSYSANDTALASLFADDAFQEASKHHMINGYMYCNNPLVTFTAGQRIRFHVMAYGSQTDLHTPTIYGGMYQMLGLHRSSFATVGGGMTSMDVVFTEPGKNKNMMCRVHDHIAAGMLAKYNVKPAIKSLASAHGKTRTYYIAADTVMWDYTAGTGAVQQCTRQDLSEAAAPYISNAAGTSIGPKRQKALYRQYSVSKKGKWTLKHRTGADAYLGLLGPVIYAEVGDTIVIKLKNNLKPDAETGPITINFAPDGGLVSPHGQDNSRTVPPDGKTVVTYKFIVPPEAGPLKGDFNTVAVPYLSTVDLIGHTSAGLAGVIIIGNKGTFGAGNKIRGIDQLLVLDMQVTNEAVSVYYKTQLKTYLNGEEPKASDFQDTNLMRHINGFSWCNMPAPMVKAGSKVRVVALGLGSEEGVHSPDLVGQTQVSEKGLLEYSTLMPSVVAQADYHISSSAGMWPIVDDVISHQHFGMTAQLKVVAPVNRKQKM